VKMKKEYQEIISEHLGVEPVMINSALVSAQNRVRLYWTNIPGLIQPEDKGLVLKDIIEDGVVDRTKSHCLDANYFKGGNLKSYFEKHRRQLVFSKNGLCHVGDADLKGNDSIKRVYHPDGKSPTLTTMQGGHREPKVLCGRIVGRKINPNTGKRDDYNPDLKAEQRLEPRLDEKSGTLTTVQKDNVVITHLTYRKLTPLEYERLQTVPDGYTAGVSNTQRYKLLGNGFTVDVIKHILQEMIQ
jgi:site-specific DNA-cytosine methylase